MKKKILALLCFLPFISFAQELDCTVAKKRIEQEIGKTEVLNKMSDDIKNQIISTYVNTYKENKNQGFLQLFKVAISRSIKDTAMYYPIFKSTIDSKLELQSKSALEEYKQTYKLTNEQIIKIEPLVKERILKLELCQYYFPENAEKRTKASIKIKDKYRRRILATLTENGICTHYSKYCSALVFERELILTKLQKRKLVIAAINIEDEKKVNAMIDTNKRQLERLKEILTDRQFEAYLTLISKQFAKKEVDKKWIEIKKLGLDVEEDSAQVCKQLENYYSECEKVRKKYSIVPDSEETVSAQLTALNEITPGVLKKLKAVKKRERISNKQDNNSLMW